MLKTVTVTNPKGESLVLELTKPEKSGLIIKDITGLGPSKATINAQELATMDGSIYSSARVENRNIVITLAMMFAPTIEDSRQKTYRYFPLKKKVTLKFETDNRTSEITGYVESNEPEIFSEEETTQISIICTDPYFYESKGSSNAFFGVEPLFEFPFENRSYTEKLLLMGEIRMDSRAIVNYVGDIDTGMIITIHTLGDAKNFTIYNVDTRETMAINTDKIKNITGLPFRAGDDIEISTHKGNKYVRLLRNGVYTNIISAMGKNADWFQLSVGDNIFDYQAEEGADNLLITFAYRNAYGGI